MITKNFKSLILITVLSATLLFSGLTVLAYQDPVGTPPACDTNRYLADGVTLNPSYRDGCNSPVNVGPITQNKPGKLQLGVLYLNEGYIPSGTPTTTLSNTFASLASGYGYLNIFGRGTPANRTVKIWENLIVPGNIYAKNYYICSGDGTNCNQFTGGSSYWTKVANQNEIIYPNAIGVAGATDPNNTLTGRVVDIAIGTNLTGIKADTNGPQSLSMVTNGINRLNVASNGVLSIPVDKTLNFGAGIVGGTASSLTLTGVGSSPNRKVTILDKVFTNEICTVGGVCNSVSNIISGVDKIVAGPGVVVSPADGKGTVTISSTGSTGNNYWTVNGANIYNSNTGNVGIGVTNPAAKLDVGGSGFFSGGLVSAGGINIMNNKTLKLGDETGDQGKIGMKTFSDGLDLVGFGALGNRMIKLWDSVTIPGSICDGAGSCSLVKNILEGAGFWSKAPGTNNISTASNIGVNGASPSKSGLNIAVADNVGLKYDSVTKELQLYNQVSRLGIGTTGAIIIPAGKQLCLGTDCRSAWPTGGTSGLASISEGSSNVHITTTGSNASISVDVPTVTSGVTQIKAGNNVTISPTTGTGVVTINAAGGTAGTNYWTPGGGGIYYSNVIGVGGATAPNSGLDLAVGNNSTGLVGGSDGSFKILTSTTNRLTIDSSGNSTFEKASNFKGGLTMSANSYVPGALTLKFGDYTGGAGTIGMGSFSGAGSGVLDIVGGGTTSGQHVVRIWDSLKVNQICSPDSGSCALTSRIIDALNVAAVKTTRIYCEWGGVPTGGDINGYGCQGYKIDSTPNNYGLVCPTGYRVVSGGAWCDSNAGTFKVLRESRARSQYEWKVGCIGLNGMGVGVGNFIMNDVDPGGASIICEK